MSVGSVTGGVEESGGSGDPVRVAVVSQQYPPEMGGNASRVGDTARGLAAEGVDVQVVAPPRSYPPETYPRSFRRHERASDGPVDVHRLWSWQPGRVDPNAVSRLAYYLLFSLHATLWLLYHRRRFDVVVCTTPPVFTGIPGLVFGELTRKPLVVDVGDLWIDAAASLGFIREESLSTRLSRRYEHLLLLRADRILTTTDEMSRLLEKSHGPAITERLVVAPNAVDVERFAPEKGSGDDGHTIVYTGIFGHAQDLEACIRAMALVESDATLKLVGDGDIRPRLERLVEELGVGDRVAIDGPVERDAVPGLLASASIGVAPLKDTPGLRYAVPLKTYEYMASGLPVVGTDMGAFSELIGESGGGLAVENTPEALAAAFDELLADPDRRERLGRQAREHVEREYDRRVVGQRLAAMLEELVAATEVPA